MAVNKGQYMYLLINNKKYNAQKLRASHTSLIIRLCSDVFWW